MGGQILNYSGAAINPTRLPCLHIISVKYELYRL